MNQDSAVKVVLSVEVNHCQMSIRGGIKVDYCRLYFHRIAHPMCIHHSLVY